MLVGEGPGAEEEKLERPFIGAAGQVLDELLNEAGIYRSDVYITNTVKCRPPNNRAPDMSESSACFPYLAEEIDSVKPAVIVCLGLSAIKILTGQKTVAGARDKKLAPRKGFFIDAHILGTYHPASLLYDRGKDGGNQRRLLVEDLKTAKAIAYPKPKDHRNQVMVLPSAHLDGQDPEVYAARGALFDLFHHATGVISVDGEWKAGTTDYGGAKEQMMLWPWNPDSEFFSLSFTGRVGDDLKSVAVAYPWHGLIGAEIQALVQRRLCLFHNAMADLIWMLKLGLRVTLGADTFVLGHLINEVMPHDLQTMAMRYAPETVDAKWKGHLYYHRPRTPAEWSELLEYNNEDTRATLLLFEALVRVIKQLPEDERRDILRLHKNMILPAIPTLVEAAHEGVPLDAALLDEYLRDSYTRQNQAAEDLAGLLQCTPNAAAKFAGSGDQIKLFFKKAYDIDLENTQKETLADLDIPAVAFIRNYKAEQKLNGTYLMPWKFSLDKQRDGRLHTIYRYPGPRTGRMAAETDRGGSIQVAPRNSEAVQFRKLVKAPDGQVIVSADASQIELRVVAWLAPEFNMRELYRGDEDIHKDTAAFLVALERNPSITAAEFWPQRHKWIELITEYDRQNAKGVNFGLAFGMAKEKLGAYSKAHYGVVMTSEQMQTAHMGFHMLYSGLKPWHDRAREQARLTGFAERTPFGRQRRFEGDDVNAAINSPIQSTANDITVLAMNQAMPRIRQEQLEATMIGTIHDSVLLLASEQHAERAGQILKWSMENVDFSAFGFTVPVPLKADIKISQTWK